MLLHRNERQSLFAEVDLAFRRDVLKGLGTIGGQSPRDGFTTGAAQNSLKRLPRCLSITRPEPSARSFRMPWARSPR